MFQHNYDIKIFRLSQFVLMYKQEVVPPRVTSLERIFGDPDVYTAFNVCLQIALV